MRTTVPLTIVFGLMITCSDNLRAQSLGTDKRLHQRVTIVELNPKLSTVLAEFKEATGLDFTVHESLKEHQPKLGGFSFRKAPVFVVMRAVSLIQLKGGRWEKTISGYQLVADRSLSSKQSQSEKPAKAARRPSSYHLDMRLRKPVPLVAENPPLSKLFRLIENETGVELTLSKNLTDHNPNYGSIQFRKAKAWIIMDLIVKRQIKSGRWIKTSTGYRLEGTSAVPDQPAVRIAGLDLRGAYVAFGTMLGMAAVFLYIAGRALLEKPARKA